MDIFYIRDPEDSNSVFIIPPDAEEWTKDPSAQHLKVRIRAFPLREFFAARAEVQAENENREAALDEVIERLISNYNVVEIEESSEGIRDFADLPLAVQIFLIGRVQRLVIGAVDLPFRREIGGAGASKPKRTARRRA
jgi:hypothetical protein